MRELDERAFTEYASGAARSLRRTAYLMTGDWHRADDVVQNALVKLYVAWPRLARSGGFPTYARRVVVNAAIDESRKGSRREHPTEQAGAHEVDERDRTREIDDRLLIISALAGLPARQRATVVLRYYDDLSVNETAEVLGCTPGTVKSQTARGLDALRELLVAAGVREPITVGEDHP